MSSGATGAPSGRPRVLVVDDEPHLRSAICRSLSRLGYETAQAEDGRAGLAAVEKVRPQVVVLDLVMPQMNGRTFLRIHRDSGDDAAVVILSAMATAEEVVEILRMGAVDFVFKPYGQEELAKAVGRAVEVYRERALLRDLARSRGAAGATPRAASAAEASAGRIRELAERMRRGELPLPPAPAVLTTLRQAVSAPEVHMGQIALQAERDQRVAAEVVRMSNTAFFARGGRNASVQVALGRLGLQVVSNIVETLHLRAFAAAHEPNLRRRLEALWRRAVAQAACARAVAGALADRGPAPDAAYLAGLMADVGASALLYLAGQDRRDPLGADDEAALFDAVSSHHEQIGATLLLQWQFDEKLVEAVRAHHGAPPPGENAYWPVVAVASWVATLVSGVADPTARPERPLEEVRRIAESLALTLSDLEALVTRLEQEVAELVGGGSSAAASA